MSNIRSTINTLAETAKSDRCTLGWHAGVIFECDDDEPGVHYEPTHDKPYTHPHNGYVVLRLKRCKRERPSGRIYGEFDGLETT